MDPRLPRGRHRPSPSESAWPRGRACPRLLQRTKPLKLNRRARVSSASTSILPVPLKNRASLRRSASTAEPHPEALAGGKTAAPRLKRAALRSLERPCPTGSRGEGRLIPRPFDHRVGVDLFLWGGEGRASTRAWPEGRQAVRPDHSKGAQRRRSSRPVNAPSHEPPPSAIRARSRKSRSRSPSARSKPFSESLTIGSPRRDSGRYSSTA